MKVVLTNIMALNFLCEVCGAVFIHWLIFYVHRLTHVDREEDEAKEERTTTRSSVIQYAPIRYENVVVDEVREATNRDSVIRYAPPPPSTDRLLIPLQVDDVSSALGSNVKNFSIHNKNNYNLEIFFFHVIDLVKSIILSELQRLHLLKFILVLDTNFINIEHEITLRSFISRARSVNETLDLDDIITECLQELILKITEHEGRGSGWSLNKLLKLNVRVMKQGYGDRGSGFIILPKKLLATRSCINVQNGDVYCFKYALLVKHLDRNGEINLLRPDARYNRIMHLYNFDCVTYPLALKDVSLFERRNPGVSVNVFGLDGNKNIYPLKVVNNELRDHTDMLLLKENDNAHYVYIKDFNRLIRRQLTKHSDRITVCKRCFAFKSRDDNRWLIEHNRLCGKHQEAKIVLPKKEKAKLYFNKRAHQYKIPIVIYADFESTLIPIQQQARDDESDDPYTDAYKLHTPNSYCILIKSELPEAMLHAFGLTTTPYVVREENVARKFMSDLHNIAERVENLYKTNLPMKDLTLEQIDLHNQALLCYLCKKEFTVDNSKVHDHDHLTGDYRGAACNSCNINFKLPNFIPVVMHNLSGYDAHFIIPELGYNDKSIDIIATSSEKFISFSKKIGRLKLRFIDSFRFMSFSLNTLAKNLRKEDFKESCKLVPDEHFSLIQQKGIYPYDYIDSVARFNETTLPPIENFFNSLDNVKLKEEEYRHAQAVWTAMGISNLGEYSDFYVKLDVTLLCDVMQQFRTTCFEAYGLDPLHYYTSPGLAWNAMLKETQCELELLTDPDMLLMIESGIRGGLTQCVKKYHQANNIHVRTFNPDVPSSYLAYFDANNLYGFSMIQPLPYGDFKWVAPLTVDEIKSLAINGDKGYIIECDISYPDRLHDVHYDLPLLPHTDIPPNGKFKKLLTTLEDKSKYVAHFATIKQAIEMGLIVTRVYRVLEFSQSYWLQPYINNNTVRRAASNTSFGKEFYKLLNNSIFGKTLENKRKHKDIRLVSSPEKLSKLTQKANFKSCLIINENLVAVSMKKTKIVMNRPLYVGMCILDISKTVMYDFHYNKMVKYYGRERIGIAYTDTDSFAYWILTDNLYRDLRTFPYATDFDFSDYPVEHPNYDGGRNKKVLGKFKDEVNGEIIIEYVGLMPKLYSIRVQKEKDPEEIKKAKGIKKRFVEDKMSFDKYKNYLFDDLNKKVFATFNTIRSYNHKVYSVTQYKRCLSKADDKRIVLEDGISTLPYGHYTFRNIGNNN